MKSFGSLFPRSALWLVGFALALGGMASPAGAMDVSRDLPGVWSLTENFRAVDDPGNARTFQISRVVLNPSKWADGEFDLKFDGESSPIRGYFSIKTGRIWIKAQRRVNGRLTSVEYIGTLREDADGTKWTGLANTDGRALSWGFEATRLPPLGE